VHRRRYRGTAGVVGRLRTGSLRSRSTWRFTAKVYQKAIEAALDARQYSRALQLVDAIDADSARPYYKQLARYYEDLIEAVRPG
jgi:hypothetical protein